MGLNPYKNNIKAVQNMDVPFKLQNVQVFLFMVGYYHQFIANFVKLNEPLVALVKGIFLDGALPNSRLLKILNIFFLSHMS